RAYNRPTMNTSDPTPAPRPDRCPRCGVAFACGVDSVACWCTGLPPIDPARLEALDAPARAALGLPAGMLSATCLCPDCLSQLAAALDGRCGQAPR
ncbi:MAG TPA: cysteine-rich CWC family protein, partial [Burkholderiaceae bacterium]|nr:cysteine-rich CWC family protein [Burkholderiaceae bacterium]